jgi:hypothetical protein
MVFLLKEGNARFLDDKVKKMRIWLMEFWKRTANLEIEGVR